MAESNWAGAAYLDAVEVAEGGGVEEADGLPVPGAAAAEAHTSQAASSVEAADVPHEAPVLPAPAVVRSSEGLVPMRVRPEQRRATKGWRGAVRRATLGSIAPRAGAEEVSQIRDRLAVNGQWSEPRTVVVANPKGGAGKTATVVGLGATFGDVRGGAVVAWDNNETMGTLGIRTVPQRFSTTAVDLLANLARFERADARKGELGGFTRHQESGQYDVLVSDEDPRRMSQIGAPEFCRILDVLKRYYDIIVVDTGNNTRATNFLTAMDSADVLVIPISWAEDVVRSAGRLIDQLRETGHGDLVARAVTVVTGRAGADATGPQISAWRQWYAEQTSAVIEIPYDAHIASGGAIVYSDLAPASRRAYLRVAAAVATGFTDHDQARTYRLIKENQK
jgi:MinD-like ATPase involved in chromosome partitioning or flagellar assembly